MCDLGKRGSWFAAKTFGGTEAAEAREAEGGAGRCIEERKIGGRFAVGPGDAQSKSEVNQPRWAHAGRHTQPWNLKPGPVAICPCFFSLVLAHAAGNRAGLFNSSRLRRSRAGTYSSATPLHPAPLHPGVCVRGASCPQACSGLPGAGYRTGGSERGASGNWHVQPTTLKQILSLPSSPRRLQARRFHRLA